MDPIEHAARYHDNLAYEMEYEDFIQDKMKEQRKEIVDAVGSLVRLDVAGAFSKILSAAYEYGCPEAEKIAKMLGLNQRDFLSIEDKYEEYKRDYEDSKLWRNYE